MQALSRGLERKHGHRSYKEPSGRHRSYGYIGALLILVLAAVAMLPVCSAGFLAYIEAVGLFVRIIFLVSVIALPLLLIAASLLALLWVSMWAAKGTQLQTDF